MRIIKKEIDRELRYQISMHFVKLMLLDGLISEHEFYQIEIRNRERYKPFIGILLSGKFLLRYTDRVDVFIAERRSSKLTGPYP